MFVSYQLNCLVCVLSPVSKAVSRHYTLWLVYSSLPLSLSLPPFRVVCLSGRSFRIEIRILVVARQVAGIELLDNPSDMEKSITGKLNISRVWFFRLHPVMLCLQVECTVRVKKKLTYFWKQRRCNAKTVLSTRLHHCHCYFIALQHRSGLPHRCPALH